jgi:dihydrofolate reductase
MLLISMAVSADGFINDRDGGLDWGVQDPELVRFQHAEVGRLGAYLLGRRLYETMSPWETDASMRATEEGAAFADAWAALPKVVFSRTLHGVPGNARLATRSLAEEVSEALAATDRPVSIGGANLAGQAIELGLVDELRMFRHPVVLGAGTPYLPPVPRPVQLELAETRTFGGAVVYERYRRIRRPV